MSREFWLFAQYLVQCMDGVTTGLMLETALSEKDDPLSRRCFRIACYFGLVALICLPSWLLHHKFLPALNLIFTIAGFCVLTTRLYGVRLQKAATLFALYLFAGCLSELVFAVLFQIPAMEGNDWTQDVIFEPLFLSMLFTAGLKLLLAWLYRLKGQEKTDRQLIPHLCFFSLLLWFLLAVPFWNMARQASSERQGTWSLLIYFFCFLSVTACLALIFHSQRLHNTRSLQAARDLSEMQNRYYTWMEQNSQAQARLFHDYKNVIAACRGLLRQERPEEACQVLQDFQQRLDRTALPVQMDSPELPVLSGESVSSENLPESSGSLLKNSRKENQKKG